MFEKMSTGAVESELVGMAGHLAAGTCRFLQLLAEFDQRHGWAGPGLRSCAHWLGWRVGLNLRTARDHLRVAHALRALPAITAAFAAGRVSYSKVRALTRIATPATEQGLLHIALHGTTSQLEGLVAATRAATDPRPAQARRSLRTSRAADGSLLVTLRIPAERGDEFLAAVEAHLKEQTQLGGSAEPSPLNRAEREVLRARAEEHTPGAVTDPLHARRLDALLDLLTASTPARSTTLVVHLRADTTPGTADGAIPDRPQAWIDSGPPIPAAVAERLTCTAPVRALLVDRAGNPLYLGRTRRTVSSRQLLALRVRDRGRCVFPGCETTTGLQAHHLRSWRHGGPTDLDNLALVCAFHHRLVHEHGYHLQPGPNGPTCTRPDGTPVPATGPPTSGSAADLVARHTARRLHIDDQTITPRWGGEPLDRDHVLTWLLPELDSGAAA